VHICRDEIRASKRVTQTHAIQLVADPEEENTFFIVNGHHRFEAFRRIKEEGWWHEVQGAHRLTPEEQAEATANGLTYDDNVMVCDEVILCVSRWLFLFVVSFKKLFLFF
jgi:hypothetical protein